MGLSSTTRIVALGTADPEVLRIALGCGTRIFLRRLHEAGEQQQGRKIKFRGQLRDASAELDVSRVPARQLFGDRINFGDIPDRRGLLEPLPDFTLRAMREVDQVVVTLHLFRSDGKTNSSMTLNFFEQLCGPNRL